MYPPIPAKVLKPFLLHSSDPNGPVRHTVVGEVVDVSAEIIDERHRLGFVIVESPVPWLDELDPTRLRRLMKPAPAWRGTDAHGHVIELGPE